MGRIKECVVSALEAQLEKKLSKEEIQKLIEIPKDISFGDIAFPCHPLSKLYKKSPIAIADELQDKLRENKNLKKEGIVSVENIKGYLNFKYDYGIITKEVLKETIGKKENYGRNNIGNGKTAVVDFSSPNLGKPMHVGHIRSTIIGDSVIKLLKFSGYKTYGINYLGDSGLHIGKLITAYNMWGDDKKLKKDPEKEMFDLYVKFVKKAEETPSLENEAKNVLKDIEDGNDIANNILIKIRNWSSAAFGRVYELLNVGFDETAGQSLFSEKGRLVVKDALEKKVAVYSEEKDDDDDISINKEVCVIVDLKDQGLPPKVILASRGRAIYSTQDLGAAVDRYDKHHFDKMIYVVANEQSLYFKQIFKILEIMGYDWSKNCEHLGFGLINLAEGRMSTREGKIVLLEDLLGKSIDLARQRLIERKMPDELKDEVAKIIGIGSIKYQVLQITPTKEIVFSWDKALDYTGNSAPYIQYSYVRASRIIEKSEKKIDYSADPMCSKLTLPEEINLIRKIEEFPDIVKSATTNLKPNLVANYANEVAQSFNDYYQKTKIRGSLEEEERLLLVESIRTVLKNSCNLLGIELPERM